MEFINRMRKDKKGFTLVEIIVVLVILAILAAFMIPSMLGFVGDAKDKAALAQAREVYIAAQSAATETIATQAAPIVATELTTALSDTSTSATSITNPKMAKYLDKDIPVGATWTTTAESLADTGVTDATKTNATGRIKSVEFKLNSTSKIITIKSDGSAVTIS